MKNWCALGVMMIVGCGCSQAPQAQGANVSEPVADTTTYRSPQGVSYSVTPTPGFKEKLPPNSDLKMADNDLGKYAETLCTLDVPPKTAPRRCDIYVQSDPEGTLIGYAAVIEDESGVRFETATDLNEKKQPGGGSCYIGGKLAGSGENWEKPINDSSKDFTGQFAYMAWEKDPGNWMVSPMDSEPQPDNASGGVWYVEKKTNKLHIYQERWNYCYRDSKVNVDDVFYEAVSLLRL